MAVSGGKSPVIGGLCICEPISWLQAGHTQETAALAGLVGGV